MSEQSREGIDDRHNNVIMTGAVQAVFAMSGRFDSVENVLDDDNGPTNQLDVTVDFMKSPYRITIERVPDE
jgi:hypothetical protein